MRWLVLLLLITACAPEEPLPYEPYTFPEQNDTLRPEIPRGYVPNETRVPPVEQPNEQPPVFIREDIVPHLTLEVPITEAIGENHKVITVEDFPLLRHSVIPLGIGSYASYDELIIFDFKENTSGRIIFGTDPVTDAVGTFLLFEEDMPIFEYRAVLQSGRWEQMLGSEVQILGHTYVLAEASNTSLVFFGVDVANNLLFENGSKLVADSTRQQNTLSFVSKNVFGYRLLAKGSDTGDDILIEPGETLSENVGHDKLASKILDLRYEGTETIDVSRISIDKVKFGYRLIFEGPDGVNEVPLVEEDGGALFLGELGSPLHLEGCTGKSFCIKPDDLVLLTTPAGGTYVMTYADVSEDPNRLIMEAPRNRYSYEYIGTPGKDAFTDITIGGHAFRTWIGPRNNLTGEYNISIVLPRRDREIFVAGGYRVKIGEVVQNRTLPLEIIVPRQATVDRREERTFVNITFDGTWKISVGNVSLAEIDDSNDAIGITKYGTTFLLDRGKRNDLEANQAEELEILIPRTQAFGRVRLEG